MINQTLIHVIPGRVLSSVSPMIYGQFLEHFHRQIYDGIFDPGNSLSDEDGLRMDVLDAMRRIHVPILRWPGGCFVSAYHWADGVGKKREPVFDKAWRVVEPNTFGTDEYIRLCRKIGCEPYICTNAGTGTSEEMSAWVEYCNLPPMTRVARLRKENGHADPFRVKYWSIGNENYGSWEIGARSPEEWGRLVCESAKMMRRTDPAIELSAAALADMDWNAELLKNCGEYLDWISIHGYWDFHKGKNELAGYHSCMQWARDLEKPVRQVKGLLTALGFDHIRIAYDEWNLRAWYHPNIMDVYQGKREEEYLTPRDDNDRNEQYTMADAVFSACFLNMCIRMSDTIGMAAFSPTVNTRGMIFTHKDGIVLRSTYHVFDLYTNQMEKEQIDFWNRDSMPEDIDLAVTGNREGTVVTAALVNKSESEARRVSFSFDGFHPRRYRIMTVNGDSEDSYNTADREEVSIRYGEWKEIPPESSLQDGIQAAVAPHSVNVIRWE